MRLKLLHSHLFCLGKAALDLLSVKGHQSGDQNSQSTACCRLQLDEVQLVCLNPVGERW